MSNYISNYMTCLGDIFTKNLPQQLGWNSRDGGESSDALLEFFLEVLKLRQGQGGDPAFEIIEIILLDRPRFLKIRHFVCRVEVSTTVRESHWVRRSFDKGAVGVQTKGPA